MSSVSIFKVKCGILVIRNQLVVLIVLFLVIKRGFSVI